MNKSAAIAFAAALLALTVSVSSDATGPTDKGIAINYGAAPLTSPYNGLPAHAVMGINYSPSTVASNDFASPLRLQLFWQQGGAYNGSSQTAYPIVNANTTMRGQGQGIGYWNSIGGYGKGNAGFGNGVSNCYGGGETSLPSSTPYCAAVGEFDAIQGTLVWRATVANPTSVGMTTVHYTGVADESALGARAVLNINHVHETGTISSYTTCQDSTAGACSVIGTVWGVAGTCPLGVGSSCSVVTFSGSTLPTATADHWYFKSSGNNDNYTGACSGDDVSIHSRCYGHWYKVANVPDTTHLVLSGVFDSINLNGNVGSGTYLMVEGVEATSVDSTNHTLTIPANTLNWTNGEVIYSPPSHYQGLIGELVVITKEYKTGPSSAPSYGYAVNSNGGQPVEDGLWVTGTGGFRRGVKIENGNTSNNDAHGVDVSSTYNYGYLYTGNEDATHTAVSAGTSGQCRLGCGTPGDGAGAGQAWTLGGKEVSVSLGFDNDAGGFKAGTLTDAVNLNAGASRDETVTWTSAFRGTNYYPVCSVEDPSKVVQVVALSGKTSAHVVVTVKNTDSSTHNNFVINCFAPYFGN